MLYFYGDSHAEFSFRDLEIPHTNLKEYGITMFRIGRDNKIINYDNAIHNKNSIICLCYGEVDCRCHIQRQIDLGRSEDIIIDDVVSKYIIAIKNNIKTFKKIVIIAVIPPVAREDTCHNEEANPIVGTNLDRVRYTLKINNLLNCYCAQNDFIYFDPYIYYKRPDGTLKFEYSDGLIHIGKGKNAVILKELAKLYKSIIEPIDFSS